MGLFDFLGGGSKKGSVEVKSLMPAWQQGLGSDLSAWARKYLQLYQPGQAYGDRLSTTTPTGLEATGLKELEGLLGRPATGDLFGAAKGQVLDTLSGKYADPATSPFIQSFSKLAGQNLQDSINTARGQRGARGTYFTRAGIQEESRLGERTQNALNAIIGEFLNTERGRQQAAVGQARELEGYETDASLSRVRASQQFGGLQRLLEQADLERRYDAWLNQRRELSQVPGAAQSVFGTNVPMTVSTTAPKGNTFAQDIAPWIKLAARFIPGLGGAAAFA